MARSIGWVNEKDRAVFIGRGLIVLKPKVDVKEFEKFGFKKCKGDYGKNGCYYLCVSRGMKMLFVSPEIFAINEWNNDDPRIHKRANCKYRDCRTDLDVLYDLIKAGMLEKTLP